MELERIIRSIPYTFTKGKSCWPNLIAFYDGMTGLVDEERAVAVVYLDFNEAFETLFHNILVAQEGWIR